MISYVYVKQLEVVVVAAAAAAVVGGGSHCTAEINPGDSTTVQYSS